MEWPARRMTMADTGNAIHLTLNATSCKKNRRTCSFTQVCRLIAMGAEKYGLAQPVIGQTSAGIPGRGQPCRESWAT